MHTKKGVAIATPFFVLPQLFGYGIAQIPDILQLVEFPEFKLNTEHFLNFGNHKHVGQ